MSKKNKKKNNPIKKNPEPISMTSVNEIFAKSDILNEVPKEIGQENTQIDKIQKNFSTVSSEKDKLSESAKIELEQLLSGLKDVVEIYKEAKQRMESKDAEFKSRDKELNEKKASLDQKETSLNNQEHSIEERELVLDTREIELAKREAIADAGFKARENKWKDEAISKFRKEYESYNTRRQEEISRYKEARRKYDTTTADLEHKADLFKIQNNCFEEAKTELEKHYKERLADEKQNYANKFQRLKKDNNSLQEQIQQYDDIRAQLGGHSASEINTIIAVLKSENAQLKLELQNIGSAEYQQTLEEQLQQSKDDNEALITENNALQIQCNQLRNKLLDVDGLKAINETLKTHNKALQEAQKQLKNELNELTDKDNNKEIFAEFKGIEVRCKTSYSGFTQSDGNLKNFVNAVGYQLTQYSPNLFYTPETLQLFVGGLAMSRLILLQGISGTGKTKLAQAFSSIVGDNQNKIKQGDDQESCSCIVSVQAGWRDNQDLLGYYNAFEKKFYEKTFSKGLYAASTPAFKDRLYFLILDEMNLSHPEQYFADFISAMEQANSVSDAFEVELLTGIPKEIVEDENRWPLFLHKEKIVVPSNVWFIGTANHDETTMEFADKTYDRAHIMVMDKNIASNPYRQVGWGTAHWSASDLRAAFEEAQNSKEGKDQVDRIKQQLNTLNNILKKEFDISFGNRLERQVENFVPVVCAAGGTEQLALDHLIATKIIRKGKITGLFGVQKESLETLRDEILTGEISLKEDSQTIKLLNQDISAKERGR